jgi:hypothetical protein
VNTIEFKRRELGERFDLRSSQKHVFQLPGVSEARVLEFDDVHFHEESAILLPDPDPEGGTGSGDRVTGLSLLAACYRHAEKNTDQRLLVAGHAVADEPEPLDLSQGRATQIHTALNGDRDTWRHTADTAHRVQDYQHILKWMHHSRGWDCDPGPIDDILGSKTKGGIWGFQETYNTAFDNSIAVDGIMGPQTWGAIFDVYMEALQNVLETDAEGLQAYRRMLRFIDPSCYAVGCGTAHPIPSDWASDYRSQTDRRVETFFFARGDEPRVDDPVQDPDTPPQIDIFDPLWYQFLFIPHSTSPTVVEASVEIAKVEGLYKPGHDDDHGKLSGYEEGYVSGDDRGRIFINHKPITQASDDWQQAWEANTQYIELTAKLKLDSGDLPADARVVWEWGDPDDPTDTKIVLDGDEIDVREKAGQHIDPSDYSFDEEDGAVKEEIADDNRGECDYPTPGSGEEATFEEVGSYTMKETGDRKCETAIEKKKSKVRLHCTNVGGDNFKVWIRIKPHPAIKVKKNKEERLRETGFMTMWKRIDVEYRKMPNASDLPVDEAAKRFETCFVQLDFTEPDEIPDSEYIIENMNQYAEKCRQLVGSPPTGVFKHEYDPGWFLIVAVRGVAEDLGDRSITKVHPRADDEDWGPATLITHNGGGTDRWEGIVVDHDITEDVNYVRFKEGDDRFYLGIDSKMRATPTRGKTTLELEPLDYHSEFEPGNGRQGWPGGGGAYHRRTYYYPRHRLIRPANVWVDDGLRFPSADVQVSVVNVEGGTKGGRSPSIRGYFSGRTILFTKNHEDDASLLSSIVHELTHAFGFPHKCGYYALDSPAEKSCAMNYSNTWLYEEESGDIYEVKAGDESLDQIAIRNGLYGWRTIYYHPRNEAFREKYPDPSQLDHMQVGDKFWLPARQVQWFETGKDEALLCGKHIDGVRRVHLEDNPQLWRP